MPLGRSAVLTAVAFFVADLASPLTAAFVGAFLGCLVTLELMAFYRLLDPLTDVFTPEVASAVIRLRADSETEARIEEMRGKANAGTPTPPRCRVQ
jgi:hypothetical protein